MYYTRMLLYDQIHSAVEPEMPATPPIEIHEAIRVRFPANPSYHKKQKNYKEQFSTASNACCGICLSRQSSYTS